MLKFWTCFYFITAAVTCFGQPTRLELLSRSEDHARKKAEAAIGAPEFSRDGNFIFYLSAANNLTTNSPLRKPVVNLFMFDRRSGQTMLVSQGLNGESANDDIIGFDISTNSRRILFETAASNIVENDTNNATDIFIRDLDLNTNILVTANINGSVSRLGASSGSISGDGSFVTFSSYDRTLVNGSFTTLNNAYVRDVAAGTNRILKVPSNYRLYYAYEPVISDDGRLAAFAADAQNLATSAYSEISILCDLQTGTSIRMAPTIPGQTYDPLITPDGKYVTFGIYNTGPAGATNVVVRYATDSGDWQIIASNNVAVVRPISISSDGKTILYSQWNSYRVYREGLETRVFPKAADGSAILLPGAFGTPALRADSAMMSANGKVVTFSTDVPLLAADGEVAQFRTYIYDVEQDLLSEIPATSYVAPRSDPVPNSDGSFVVFTGASAGIQDQDEAAEDNIYLWERATGQIQLISKLDRRLFENTEAADSKIPETGAFSDDGQKMVFASRAPASEVADENGSWDVFVLDRATGQKQLVSISAGGQSVGSGASMQPIISGNGQFVAFISAATNLVGVDTQGRLELYVRDLVNGVTRLVRNKDGGAPLRGPVPGSLSFSADGKLLCFASRAIDLDARDSQSIADVYVYDTAYDVVSLVTYDATKTTGANADCVSPAIGRDGQFVVFRSSASNLGASGNSFDVCIRDLKTGGIRKATVPMGTSGAFKNTISINPDSTMLYFASYGPHFYSYALTNTSFTNRAVQLATNVYEGSVSADGKWIALTRRITSPPSLQVYLRNVTNGVELCVSSNVTAAAIGNGNSSRPQISADGRFTIFESRASNLVANDTNEATDLFIYDRDQQRLDLLSAKADGSVANGFSMRGVICPDQSAVMFVSFASDLVPHDYNEGADIFAAYLPAPDTDGDGIDDRWEMTQFGTLDHDMTQDTDGDGLSDAAEFQAQTDPNQAGSGLRVISANVDVGQNIVVRWASIPGRAYRVQARARFDAENAWEDVTDAIVSSNNESAFALPPIAGANELYFRIVSAD